MKELRAKEKQLKAVAQYCADLSENVFDILATAWNMKLSKMCRDFCNESSA